MTTKQSVVEADGLRRTQAAPEIVQGYSLILNEIGCDTRLTLAERGFFTVLLSFQRYGKPVIYVSNAQLVERANCSVRTAQRILSKYQDLGIIAREINEAANSRLNTARKIVLIKTWDGEAKDRTVAPQAAPTHDTSVTPHDTSVTPHDTSVTTPMTLVSHPMTPVSHNELPSETKGTTPSKHGWDFGSTTDGIALTPKVENLATTTGPIQPDAAVVAKINALIALWPVQDKLLIHNLTVGVSKAIARYPAKKILKAMKLAWISTGGHIRSFSYVVSVLENPETDFETGQDNNFDDEMRPKPAAERKEFSWSKSRGSFVAQPEPSYHSPAVVAEVVNPAPPGLFREMFNLPKALVAPAKAKASIGKDGAA